MKKVYMIACGVLISLVGTSQSVFQNVPPQKILTKDQISPLVSPRGEIEVVEYLRENILLEDFEGSVPALPDGWSTNEVTSFPDGPLGGALTDAFITGDAAQANIGSYWPVPDLPPGNNFAQANDDGPPCDCDMSSAILQSPAMDFTDVINAALAFDIFHDKGFGGGDAALEISLDDGASWAVLVDILPDDEVVWQTVIVPLYDYSGEGSVIVRWNWTDAGSWASGFAVDNVCVGELADYNLKTDKVVFGNWNLTTEEVGWFAYSRVPESQLAETQATAFISNNGFLDQMNVSFDLEVFINGGSQGVYAASSTTPDLLSLDKDTIVAVTGEIPAAVAGDEVSIMATSTSDSGDEIPEDDVATRSYMVTDLVYALDDDAAQAFISIDGGYEFGNLFQIHDDVMCGGVSFAIGAGSESGATFNSRLYEFTGFDEAGAPILEDVGLETQDHTILDSEMNGVNGNMFVDLPFYGGAQMLEGGKTYLAVAICYGGADQFRTPVSGSQLVPAQLLFDGEWGWTSSIPMMRLNMDVSIAVEEEAPNEFVVQQNIPNPATSSTRINYRLAAASEVTLQVTDVMGRLVHTQDMGTLSAGPHVVELDVDKFQAGIYSYTLTAGTVQQTRQMVVR
jgi:hypothetical protein